MIDSCRLPCRIRVDTVWKIGKGGGSTDKKEGGDDYESRQIRAERNCKRKTYARLSFLPLGVHRLKV